MTTIVSLMTLTVSKFLVKKEAAPRTGLLTNSGQPLYIWAKAGQVPAVQVTTSQVAQPEEHRNDSPVEAEAEPPPPGMYADIKSFSRSD